MLPACALALFVGVSCVTSPARFFPFKVLARVFSLYNGGIFEGFYTWRRFGIQLSISSVPPARSLARSLRCGFVCNGLCSLSPLF